ncbi:hypothetical protein GCM10011513_34030 [Franconibacter daqui]|nr:hypothetical protein GCM10011513_34030 [Franconibacter daqui]
MARCVIKKQSEDEKRAVAIKPDGKALNNKQAIIEYVQEIYLKP